ncbi:hypothetical protein [Actinotalea sp. C106]|uniref:hypothetical protein n=1 Tax=Actinotalea sp. C106 TaxID=2908644 RepID=UPI0020286A83|nr:hypothetical protein [Actinotalea sp. C106]
MATSIRWPQPVADEMAEWARNHNRPIAHLTREALERIAADPVAAVREALPYQPSRVGKGPNWPVAKIDEATEAAATAALRSTFGRGMSLTGIVRGLVIKTLKEDRFVFPTSLARSSAPIIPSEPWAHRTRYADLHLTLCTEGPSWWYIGARWSVRDASSEELASLPVHLTRPTTLMLMGRHAGAVLHEHAITYQAPDGTPPTGPAPTVIACDGVAIEEVRRYNAAHRPDWFTATSTPVEG